MQTSDDALLFQTSNDIDKAAARQRKVAAAEHIGRPIHVKGKILALAVRGDLAFVAESGWQARCLDLITGNTRKLYQGHQGPVTALALSEVHDVNGTQWLALFTGSWDKTIRIWNAESGRAVTTLLGHTDFIKSLTVLSPTLLVSTSSDRTIRVWDLSALSSAQHPTCVQTLKDHTRPVETAISSRQEGILTVWTADSMGVIKRYRLEGNLLEYTSDLRNHETSIRSLLSTEEGMWSASMDKTAMYQSTSSLVVVPHPHYVTALLLVPAQASPTKSLLVTGSEDEELRIWDIDQLAEGHPQPLSVVQGHSGQITALQHWYEMDDAGRRTWCLISASLDGTIRRWSLNDLLIPPKLEMPAMKESEGMTEDEERELAELLSEEDG